MDFRSNLSCSDVSEFLGKVESLKNSWAATRDVLAPKIIIHHLTDNQITDWKAEVEALSEVVSFVLQASSASRSTRSVASKYSRISEILESYRSANTSEAFGFLSADVFVGDEFADTNSLVIDLNKLVEYLSALPRYYPHDNSIKTLPLVLDAIVTAIR